MRAAIGVLLAVLISHSGPSSAYAAGLSLTAHRLTLATKTYGAPIICNLSAAADSYISLALSTSNFGTGPVIEVNSSPAATERLLIRFDLGSCAIPAGAIVHSANLRVTTVAPATAAATYSAQRVTADWVETTITWSNQPPAAPGVSGSASVTLGAPAGTIVQWSVIGDVQAFVAGAQTNRGWRVVDSAEGSGSRVLPLNSREASSGVPQLVITYVS